MGFTERKPPRRIVELHGGFVLPNRVTNPINQGQSEKLLCRLKPAFRDVIGDKIANHTNGQANQNFGHESHLPPQNKKI